MINRDRLLKMSSYKSYVRIVMEYLIVKHHIPVKKTVLMVKKSEFMKLLKSNPEVVMHYEPEEWADSIINKK